MQSSDRDAYLTKAYELMIKITNDYLKIPDDMVSDEFIEFHYFYAEASENYRAAAFGIVENYS